MSEMFQKNLESLSPRYPELAARMRGHTPDPSYRPMAGPKGFLDLAVPSENGEVLLSGAQDPLEEARTYWRRKRLRNPALMVFFGLDLGYRLLAFLSNPNPNTEAYILFEKDPNVFYYFLHVVDLELFVERQNLHFVIGVPEAELFNALRKTLEQNILFTLARAAVAESDSTSCRLNSGYYAAASRALGDAANYHFAFAGNCVPDTFVGIRQMLLNAPTIAREPGINTLFGRFSGKPAVVVATGPSLDKNFHLLQEIQDRAVILTVDASLKFLLQHGVRPHFVTCLERVPQTLPFFEGLEPEACKDTVLVAVPVVRPEVYELYPGPKAIMYRPLVHFKWLRHEKGTLLTGHSAANMAFKIAEALGCNPILLVGQDLAYADTGETHASAAYWGKTYDKIVPSRMKTFRVPGNVDESVLTNEIWKLFLDSYVKDVAGFRGTVINATEGGAFIQGTKILTFRDAIDQFVGEPFAPAESVLSILQENKPEDPESYLDWLNKKHIPDTVKCIDNACVVYKKLLRKASNALNKRYSGKKLSTVLLEVYSGWVRQIIDDEFFYECAFQILQSSFVPTRDKYFDIPNEQRHVDDIHRVRLELLTNNITHTLAILAKTRELYLDPENTLPT